MLLSIDQTTLTPLPSDMPPLPQGWLNGFEAALLFNATLRTEGTNILEVGSWVGRSSCVIASAVKAKNNSETNYEIVDFGIAGPDEWQRRFGDSLFAHHDVKKLAETICFPGGTAALLKQNLVQRGLSEYVRLIILGDVSDYKTTKSYDFIFCDCTHDKYEIERNIPILSEKLSKEFILICDDIHDVQTLDIIRDISGAEHMYLSNRDDQHSKFGILTKGKYARAFG